MDHTSTIPSLIDPLCRKIHVSLLGQLEAFEVLLEIVANYFYIVRLDIITYGKLNGLSTHMVSLFGYLGVTNFGAGAGQGLRTSLVLFGKGFSRAWM